MILNRFDSSLVVIAGLFGIGLFLGSPAITTLEAATAGLEKTSRQAIHPACIEAFDPPEKVFNTIDRFVDKTVATIPIGLTEVRAEGCSNRGYW